MIAIDDFRKCDNSSPIAKDVEEAFEVILKGRITFKRNQQQVIFERKLPSNALVRFECVDLPTNTFTWGNINHWRAEIGVDKVYLKIPTELCWRIALLGWLRRLPRVGRLFSKRISGVAGSDQYRERSRWHMIEVKAEDDEHSSSGRLIWRL